MISKTARSGSVVDRTSYDVEQFVCDSLLATLIVLEVETAEQFVGIVGGSLHRHHTRRMLTGNTVEQCRVEQEVGILREKRLEDSVHVRLDNEIVIQGLSVEHTWRGCLLLCITLAQILLRLLGSHGGFEVAIVVLGEFRLQVDG